MVQSNKIGFVAEKPAKEDRFGAHGRIATAICKVIRNNPTARSIGILGDWGSGKSTVLELAQEMLSDSNERRFEFFIFDAWTHQNDPTRRALLEQLVAFLSKIGIENAADISSLDKLSGRIATQETRNQSVLKPYGIALAVAIAASPIGLILSRSTDTISIFGEVLYYVRTVGYWLLTTPLLVITLAFLTSRPTWKFWKTDFWTGSTDNQAASGFAAALVSKIPDTVFITTRKDPEPTSIEFHSAFSKLIRECYSRNIEIIIVIDNLDRVDEHEAMSMWSIMRGFFSPPGADSDANSASARLILPFDTASLVRLYAKDGVIDESSKNKSQAFIEKTFDVVFQLGPPIGSDWQSYMGECLDKSLGSISNEYRKHIAALVYQSKFDQSGTGLGVTPRKLNAYVNRIAAVFLQWEEKIHFSAVCYYAAASLPGHFDISEVVSPKSYMSPLMGELSPDWRSDVAALHYGVESEKAFQILLGPEIDLVLKGTSPPARFEELCKISGFNSAFRTFLELKMGANSTSADPAYILNAAYYASNLSSPGLYYDNIASLISTACYKAAAWTAMPLNVRKGFEVIWNRDPEAGRALIKSLTTIDENSPLAAPAQWIRALRQMSALGLPQDYMKSVLVPGDTQFYTSVIVENAKFSGQSRDDNISEHLKPEIGLEPIIASLAERTAGKSISWEVLAELRALDAVKADWDFEPIIKILDARLRGLSDPSRALNTFEGLLALYAAADETLGELRSSGIIADGFARAHAQENVRGLAVCLAALTEQDADIAPQAISGESAAGVALLADLDNSLGSNFDAVVTQYLGLLNHKGQNGRQLEAEAVLFLVRIQRKYPGWTRFSRDVLTALIEGKGHWSISFSSSILAESHAYNSLLTQNSFRTFLADRSISASTWVKSVPNLAPMAFWAAASVRTGTAAFDSAIDENARSRLRALDREAWKQLFEHDFELAVLMTSTEAKVTLADYGGSYSQAASDWWSEATHGAAALKSPDAVSILKRVRKPTRKIMLGKAHDIIINDRGLKFELKAPLLTCLFAFDFYDGSENFAVSTFILPIIEGLRPDEVSYVLASSSEITKAVRKSDNSTRHELATGLRRAISELKLPSAAATLTSWNLD
jgi:hypothetical protein